jgi:hypothetical protein
MDDYATDEFETDIDAEATFTAALGNGNDTLKQQQSKQPMERLKTVNDRSTIVPPKEKRPSHNNTNHQYAASTTASVSLSSSYPQAPANGLAAAAASGRHNNNNNNNNNNIAVQQAAASSSSSTAQRSGLSYCQCIDPRNMGCVDSFYAPLWQKTAVAPYILRDQLTDD